MNIPSFLYPLPHGWTFKLFPFLHSYKQCYREGLYVSSQVHVWVWRTGAYKWAAEYTHLHLAKLLSKVIAPIYTSSSQVCKFPLFHILSKLGITRFLKFLPIWWTWKRDSKFVICMSLSGYSCLLTIWTIYFLIFFFSFHIAVWFYYPLFIRVKSRNSESRLPGFKFWLHHTHLVSEDTLLDLPFLFPHL